MLSRLGRVLVTLCFLGVASEQATAQSLCAPSAMIGIMLDQRFGEYFVGSGTIGDDAVQLYVSDAQSWSFVRVEASGRACVVMGGRDFSFAKPPPHHRGRGT